jgi:hypothetical protein
MFGDRFTVEWRDQVKPTPHTRFLIGSVAARWLISMSARSNSTSGIALGSSPISLATDPR